MKCTECNGCGMVVYPVTVIDLDTGEVSIRQEAGVCRSCHGTGEA